MVVPVIEEAEAVDQYQGLVLLREAERQVILTDILLTLLMAVMVVIVDTEGLVLDLFLDCSVQ